MIIFPAQNTKKVVSSDFFFISPRCIIFRKKMIGLHFPRFLWQPLFLNKRRTYLFEYFRPPAFSRTRQRWLSSMLTPRNPKQVSALILSDDVIRENVKYYLADDFRKGGSVPNPPDDVRQKYFPTERTTFQKGPYLDSQLPSLISLFIFVRSISEANPKNNWMRGEQACLASPFLVSLCHEFNLSAKY